MIRSGNGSSFYLDIRKAEFIPQVLMDHINAQIPRAAAMMPSQDVLDLVISGSSKVRDMSKINDQQLVVAQRSLDEANATIGALKIELADQLQQSQADRNEFRKAMDGLKP